MSLVNYNSPIQENFSAALNRTINLNVSDSLGTVLTAGYLNSLVNTTNGQPALVAVNGISLLTNSSGGNGMSLNNGDFLQIAYSGGQGIFQFSADANNIVTLISAGATNTLYSQVAPSLATFIAMYSPAIQLVPAQGPNTLILLESMQIVQTYGSAALAAGGVVTPQYDSTVHSGGVAAGTGIAAADLFQTASTVYPFIGISGAGTFLLDASCVNKGLYLSCATQPFTGGTGSTFIIKTSYRVISTNS